MDVSDLPPLTTVICGECNHPNVVNTHFHHFKLIEIIGSGGMGAVYRALDESLNRTVALKLLRTEHMTDESLVMQFEKEAAITAAINHPNVVSVFSAGSDRGIVYMVMELVDKGSLDDLINLQGSVAEVQVLDVGIQIARGLQAAWRNGLLHRDVKPGNMLFKDAHTAKIVDFGLAALADESGHIGGEVWGTPYYVAPEKLDSPPQEDFRSDIYSLGSALFHAMAGRPPYEAEDASIVVLKTLKSQPVSLQSFAPDVSNSTNFVINRMLRKNPDERYQSYEELIEHLQYARTAITEGQAPPPRSAPPAKRTPWVKLCVAAIAIGASIYFYQQHLAHRTPKLAPVVAPKIVMMADAAERSAEARKLLAAGDSAFARQAVEAFRKLDVETVPQPLRSWNALQVVLAQFLAGQPADAVASAAEIAQRAPLTSTAPTEAPGKFFADTATLAAAGTAPAAALTEKLDPANHEAFGLLLAGVKNWTAGNHPDAVSYFTRFQSATPADPHAWIAEYQPLAASFIDDYRAFTRGTEAEQAAKVPEKKKAALEAVRDARTQLKHPGPLAEQLTTLETRLATEVAAYEAEQAAKMAALDAADAALLGGLQPRLDDLIRQLRCKEARDLVATVNLRGQSNGAQLKLMQQRTDWMATFKSEFFSDLRRANYQVEVLTITKAKLGPGVWIPTEAELKVMTPRGPFETPWSNVHPRAIVGAVQAVLRPPLTAAQIADRKWGLGLYLLAHRMNAEARSYLTEASSARREYREALAQLGLPEK